MLLKILYTLYVLLIVNVYLGIHTIDNTFLQKVLMGTAGILSTGIVIVGLMVVWV